MHKNITSQLSDIRHAIGKLNDAGVYSILASAKVNLTLDVLKKTESGYHEIQSVVHEIPSLFDVITFEKAINHVNSTEVNSSDQAGNNQNVTFFSTNPLLKFNENNTLVKAIKLFEEKFDKRVYGHFSITKNIPMCSGLGGGSSDAAAALKILVSAYGVNCCTVDTGNITDVERCHAPRCVLFEIARLIGMDVSFFINGGTQLSTHFGEVLTPLNSAAEFLDCAVIQTGVETFTEDAYKSLNLFNCGFNIHKTDFFIEALKYGDTTKMLDSLHNDFDLVESMVENDQTDNHANTENFLRTLLAGSGGARVRIFAVN